MSQLPTASNTVSPTVTQTVTAAAKSAISKLKQRIKPVVIWLSRKLRLTFNPRPERRLARLTAMLLMPWVPSLALAAPTGGQVVSGQATIVQPNASTTQINQTSNKAILDWQKFSIARGESVIFNQPGASSVALNRVLGGDPSQIFGTLKANGSVFLVNPAGVLFAPGANVNVGGLVGSTLSISNADFNAGNYRFANGGNAGSVINQGNINANGGYVALLAPTVGNDGQIIANGGSVGLGAGNKVTLSFGSTGMVNVNVDAAAAAASINNKGVVQADGGQVQFVARSADALLDTVINNSGTVRATGLVQKDGRIFLDGGSRGKVANSGTLQAKGEQAGSKGGSITVLGDKIAIEGAIDASGQAGGGTVLVGGNYQGKGVESNASYTYVSNQASIKADALVQGDGGKVIVWANEKTTFDGSISARGGAQGGNGGFVETSGKNVLRATGNVDASAAKGKAGTWLLDPNNISIDAVGANTNINVAGNVFETTDDTAVVSNTVLGTALTGGTHVKVQTTNNGANTESGNITVNATVTAQGAGTLTLDAQNDIIFTASGKIDSNGNVVNVNLNAGTNAAFTTPGTNASAITMANGAQIITGGGKVTATAKGDGITLAGINTGGGDLTVDSKDGAISQASALTVGGTASFDAGASTVTLSNSGNAISKLGSVVSGGDFILNNGSTAITLNGTVNATGKAINIATSGEIAFLGTSALVAKDVSLTAGDIGELNNATLTVTNSMTIAPSSGSSNVLINTNSAGGLALRSSEIAKLKNIPNVVIGASGGTGQILVGDQTDPLDFGTSNLTLQGGSISYSSTTPVIKAADLALTANNGAIGTSGAPIEFTLETGSTVSTTTAGGNAFLKSASGFKIGTTSLGAGALSIEAGGNISQTGAITADTLSVVNSGNDLNLSGATNTIKHLGSITLGNGDFTLTNNAASLDQVSGKEITADKLTLTNTSGDVNFGASTNLIQELGAIDVSGHTLTLTTAYSSANLTQSGALKADTLVFTNTVKNSTLSQANEISHLGTINVGTKNLTLTNTKALDQSGVITAGTLVLSNTGGDVDFSAKNNLIGNLGATSTGGGKFTLNNTGASATLTLTGDLNAGAGAVDINAGSNSLSVGSNSITAVNLTTKSSQILIASADLTGVTGTITLQPFDQAAKMSLAGSETFNITNGITTLRNSGASNIVFGQTGGTGALTVGGAANFGSTKNVTLNAGSFSDSGTNVITAKNLTLNANSANIGSAGSPIDIAVTKVSASATTASGSAYLTSSSGYDVGDVNVTSTLGLAGGALTQSGTIKASTLALTNSGDVNFSSGANQISHLGAIAMGSNDFKLKNTNALDQTGVIDVGTLSLTNTTGGVNLGSQLNTIGDLGTIDVSGQTFNLKNTGAWNLTQSGVITADSLVLTSTNNSVNFSTQTNQIKSLGAVTAANISFSLKNGQALGQTAAMTAGTFVLNNTGGASNLSQANSVGALGAITNTAGDFTFNNSGSSSSLSISSAIDAGANKIDIDAGNKALTLGNVALTGSSLSTKSSAITLTNANLSGISTSINIAPSVATDKMSLAGSETFNIDAAGIAKLKAAAATSITIGQTGGTGQLTVGAAADLGSTKTVTLNAGSFTDGGNAGRTITAGTLNLNANTASTGDIGASGNGALDLAVTSVSANTAGGNVYLTSAKGFDLGASNVGNLSLTVTTTGGDLTQSGVIKASSLAVSNTFGNTDFSTKDNEIASLGTIAASGKTFSLKDTVALAQTGVITANTLNLTNTAASSNLGSQSNAITHLGTVNATGQTFTLKNNAALDQTGVLKAATLSLTNTAGNTDLSSQANEIGQLGAIDATGRTLSLKNTAGALTQSGAVLASTLKITNTVGGVDLSSQSNKVVNLGTSTVAGDLKLSNVGAGIGLTGDLNATGAASLSSSSGSITLGSATVTATDFSLKGSSLDFGTSNLGAVTGALSVAPNSASTDINLGGGSGFNLGATDITALKGSGASSIVIGESGATGTLTIAGASDFGTKNLTLNGGSITDGGTTRLITAKNLTLNANTASTGDIGSSAANGAIDIAVTSVSANTKGGSVYLTSSGGYDVAASDVGSGALNLNVSTAGGNLTQSGVIKVGTLAVSNTFGDTTFNTQANEIKALGAIDASGKNFSLKTSVDLSQTGVLKADTLALENTGGKTELNTQNNVVAKLGAITNTAGDFSFANAGSVATLSLTADIDAGTKALSIDAGNNQLDLGSSKLTAGSIVLKSNAISGGDFSKVKGEVTLAPGAIGDSIGLATNSGFDYNVAASTIAALKGGPDITGVTIGRSDSTGAMTVVAASDFGSKPLTLHAASINDSGTQTITATSVSLNAHGGKIGATDGIDVTTATLAINTTGNQSAKVIDSTGFALAASSVGTSSLDLTAGGNVTQTGAMTAGSLAVSNTAGSTNFATQANQIDSLGTIAASGQAFSLKTGKDLSQSGAITADTFTLINQGGKTDLGSQTNVIANLGSIDSTGGDFTLNNKGAALKVGSIDATGKAIAIDTGNFAITLGNAATISASSLGLTAKGVSQDAGGVTLNAATTIDGGSAAVTLADANNQFNQAISVTNTGANAVSLRTTGALELGTVTTDNNLTVQNAGNLTSGKLSVGGDTLITLNGAKSDVTLANSGNSLAGTTTIANGSGSAQNVSVTNTHATPGQLTLPSGMKDLTLNYTKALDLGATSITGDLKATSGGAITQTGGAMSVDGSTTLDAGNNAITLDNAANVLTGSVTITKAAAAEVVNTAALKIAGVDASSLKLTTSGGSITQSGAIKVSGTTTLSAGANAITLADSANNFNLVNVAGTPSALSLRDTDAIELGSIETGSLTVQANGITQNGSGIKASGNASIDGGSGAIVLNTTSANKIDGTLALKNSSSSKDISFASNSAVQLGAVDAKQHFNLSVKSLTQDASGVSVGGTSNLSVSAGQDIALASSASNSFGGEITLSAANADLASSGAIKLGTVATTGTLGVKAVGISQDSSGVTAGGTATLNAQGGVITLQTAGNDFATLNLANTGNNAISVTDKNALVLGSVNAGGALSVTAVGITQNASGITAASTSKFTGGSGAVKLDAAANSLSGAVSASSSSDVTLNNTGALALGDIAAANLTVSASGNVSQTADAVVSGDTKVTISGGAKNVVLDSATNDFGGKVSIVGTVNDVTLSNARSGTLSAPDTSGVTGSVNNLSMTFANAGTSLPATTVNGKLIVTTGGGDITQSGILKAASASFDSGAHAITLQKDNEFGGSVSLSNTGTSKTVDLHVKNGLALDTSSVKGNLSLTASGAISQSGAVSVDGTTTLSATTVTLGAANHFAGALAMTTSAGDATINDTGAVLLGAGDISGNFALNVGAGLTQGASALKVTGTTTITADTKANQDILLANAANDLAGKVTIANGINPGSVRDVSVANSNAAAGVATLPASGLRNVDLNFSGGDIALSAFDLSGNLTLSAKGDITQTGALKVTGTTSLTSTTKGINLADGSNNFGGAVKVSTTGSNDVTLVDSNGITLDTSSVGRNLALTVGGGVSQSSGGLTVGGTTGITLKTTASQDVDLSNAANKLVGTVTIANNSGGTAHNVSITNSNAGAASFVLPSGINDLTLNQSAGAVTLPTTSISGNLSVSAGGKIDQTGTITVASGKTTTLSAAGNTILLTDANNDFGDSLTFTGKDVTLVDANSLKLGASTATGNLNVTTKNGALTQGGKLTVSGTTTIDSGSASTTLGDASNSFGGAVAVSKAQNATITSGSALALGTSGVAGNLSIIAKGDVTQTGILTVGGTTGITFDANGSAVLGTLANDLTGKVSFTNGSGSVQNVNLKNVHANASIALPASLTDLTLTLTNSGITLPSSSVGGNLNVNAAGAIAQSGGAFKVTGTSTLAASGNSITLNTASNDFGGAVSISNASDVELKDATALTLGTVATSGKLTVANTTGALNLGTSTVGGDLSATATSGDISQSGALSVTGTSTLSASGNSIDLLQAANNFSQKVALTAKNAAIVSNNALILDAGNLGGNLALTLGKGVTQAGALTVGGTLDITLNTKASQDVTLDKSSNQISGKISITNGSGSANDVSISNAVSGSANLALPASLHNLTLDYSNGSVDIAAGSLTGDLKVVAANGISQSSGTLAVTGSATLTSGGAITQSGGVLTVGKTTTLDAGSGNAITLNQSGNDFADVKVTAGKNVTLVDKNGLTLGASTVSGNLQVNTGGNLIQSGKLLVTGTSQFDVGVGANSLTLNDSDNDFQGLVSIANAVDASVTDTNALSASGSASNSLSLTAGGALTLGSVNVGAGGLTLAAGGAISQTAAATVTGTTSATMNGSANIDLGSFANDLTGKVSFNKGTGTVQNVSLWNTHSGATIGLPANLNDLTLRLTGSGITLPATSVGGKLDVTTAGAIAQSGALIVTGTSSLNAGGNAITLKTAGNDFAGAVSISSASDVDLQNDTALTLGSVTTTGNLTLKNTTGNISLDATSVGANLSVTTVAGQIKQTDAIGVTGTTTLEAGSQNITLDNAGNHFAQAVAVGNAASVALRDNASITLGGITSASALEVSAAGDIKQSAALNVTGDTRLNITSSTADILLSGYANNFGGKVEVAGGGKVHDFAFRNAATGAPTQLTLPDISNDLTLVFDKSGLELGTPTHISGKLNIATGGDITQIGALTVDKAATFSASQDGKAHAITLTLGNQFNGGVAVTNTGDVSLTTNGDMQLNGATLAGGALNLVAPGALTQTGAITQTGAGAVSLNAGTLTLNAANQVQGELTLTSGNAEFTNSGALKLATSNVTGSLKLTTGGALTQGGALTVSGATTLDANGNAITLADSTNDFQGDVTLTNAPDATLRDANALSIASASNSNSLSLTAGTTLSLGSLTVGASGLSLAAGGNISQTAAATVSGTTSATMNGNGDIDLGSFANDFTGKVSINKGTGTVQNVSLWNTHSAASISLPANVNDLTLKLTNSGIALPATSVGGKLDVNALGAISQSGALLVSGTSKLDANGNAVTLKTAGNDFAGAVTIANASTVDLADSSATTGKLTLGSISATGDVTLENSEGELSLGTTTLGGNLKVTTSKGDITQSAAVNVASGTTLLNAGSHAITLAETANRFAGGVAIPAAGAVTLTDSGALVFNGVSAGTLTATSGGNISQTDAINVTGDTALNISTGTADIQLASFANNFGGKVDVAGAGAVHDFAFRNAKAGAPTPLSLPNIGNDLTLVFDQSGLALGTPTHIVGNLSITTGGAITQNGALVVDKAASFDTTKDGGDHAITLNDANVFTGGVSLKNTGAQDVSVTAANDLQLNSVDVGKGKLNLSATGALSQTGIIKQAALADAMTINAGTVALGLDNVLTGRLSLTSGNAAITSSAGLSLGASTVTGTLDLNLKGNLDQNDYLKVTGASNITMANTGNVTLTDKNNKLDADLTIQGVIGDVNFFNTGAGGLKLKNSVQNLTLETGGVLDLSPITVTNKLDVKALGGVTQSGAVSVGGTSKFDAGTNAIVLGETGNQFTGAVKVVSASDVTLVNAGDLKLDASSMSGKLNLTTVAGDITQIGALTVGGAAKFDTGAKSIKLELANDFKDTVSISKAANVTLVDTGALNLGTSEITGNLALTIGGDLTQVKDEVLKVTGTTGITVDSHLLTNIKLADANNSLSGNVTVALAHPAASPALESIQDFELHNTAAGASSLSLPQINGNLKLLFDNSGITLTGTTINGKLDIKAGGAINQSGPLTVAGTAKFETGAFGIKLDDPLNDFKSAVTLTNTGGADVSISDTNSLQFDSVQVGSGRLKMTAGGAITQTGSIRQSGGGATITGSSIFLTNGGNQFNGVLSLNGGTIDLSNSGGVTLGSSNIGSTLTINAGGDITQTEALSVSGSATFNSSANGANIQLGELPNSFAGSVTLGGNLGNVSLRNTSSAPSTLQMPGTVHDLKLTYDNSGIILPTTIVTGNLEAKAGGDITQTGAIALTGTAKFDAGSHAIKLDTEGNNFAGAVTLSNSGANNVALSTSKDLVLAESKLGSGSLAIVAKGAISQTGAITQQAQAGKTSFTTGGATITLNHAGNDFTGTLGLNNTGDFNVVLNDVNDLKLGTSKLGDGSLTVSAHGALSQDKTAGNGIVQGSKAKGASFEAGANSIALDNAENDFVGGVKLSNSGKNNVTIVDANTLQLDKVAVGSGSLTVSGKGGITQSSVTTSAITQEAAAGDARFVTETGAIVLDNKANLITGAVSIANSGSKDVTVVNASAIKLSQVSLGSGALTVTAQGSVTQGVTGTSDALVQAAGGGKVTITANGGAIALGNKLNDFTGALSLNNSGSGAVEVVDANALVLAASSVGSGTLSVTAGGAISQSAGAALVQAANAGLASFKAGTTATPQTISLNSADNDFTGTVALSGGNSQISDKNALTLGALATANLAASSKGALNLGQGTVNGTLGAVSTNGNITQAGALTVKGASTLDAGTGSVQLTQVNNDFNGVDLKAASASITASKALALSGTVTGDLTSTSATLVSGNTTVGGNLTTTSGAASFGNTTVGGNLASTSSGTTSFGTTTVGGSLTSSSSGTTSFGNTSVVGNLNTTSGALSYGNTTVGGNLSSRATGAVSETGNLVVTGSASIDAGSNAVLLDKANDFSSLAVKGGAVTINDINAFNFGSSSVGGKLVLTAAGPVGQSAAISVDGSASINAGANAIVLDKANEFKNAVSLTNTGANGISIADSTALKLGKVSTEGNLQVSAAGLSQDASGIKVSGNTTVSAGNASLILDAASNDFAGSVSLNNSGSNAVTLVDASALALGASTLGNGAVNIRAGGAITQTEVLKVAGATTFDAGSNSITLTRANEFGGETKLIGSTADINAATALKLNLATTGAAKVTGTDVAISGSTAELSLTTSGAATQTAALTVTGASTLKVGGAMDLSQAENDFAGAVTVDGGNGTLRGANSLNVTVNNGQTLTFQAGKDLQLSGKAANLTTISGTTSKFGVVDVAGTLTMTTGGELSLLTGGALNVPNLVFNLPLTQDIGTQLLPFLIPSATKVTFNSAHNGFIQIPASARTDFAVDPRVGCVRVNNGGCINGNASISGAIAAVQSSAVSGLASKLAKEDALTKKLKYGFAGDLQQAQSFPHGGALEVKANQAAGPADLVPPTPLKP